MPGFPVLLFLDVSGGELLLIMLVVFLVFGPEKMPEMARKAGRVMNQMKKASSDLTREFKKETSVLENEIKAAQTKVSSQLDSVSREISTTRNRIINETKIEPIEVTTDTAALTKNEISQSAGQPSVAGTTPDDTSAKG